MVAAPMDTRLVANGVPAIAPAFRRKVVTYSFVPPPVVESSQATNPSIVISEVRIPCAAASVEATLNAEAERGWYRLALVDSAAEIPADGRRKRPVAVGTNTSPHSARELVGVPVVSH